MFKQFFSAIKAYGKAVRLIVKHNLWLYFIYPVIICILLYIGGIYFIDQISRYLQEQIMSWLNVRVDIPYLSGMLQFILGIGLRIIFFFAYATFVRNLVLIILSPVLSLVSEKTEELLTGKTYPFRLGVFIRGFVRGSLIALRNMLMQFLLIAACFLLMFLPVAGWITPVLLLLVNYYFYGFSMLDYANERTELSIRESFRFIRKNKGLAIGNGFIFTLIFAIPYAGVVIAPIVAVIAGTIVSIEARDNYQANGKN